MSNQYFNIAYDPSRQGFSTSTWRLLYGDVAVSGGKLQFTKSAILHYGDILRGDAIFSVNIAAPVPGDNSKFGFLHYSKNAYAYFQISNGVLTAEVSNGTAAQSSAVIPWVSSWTDVDTEFRIKWESGMITFSIGGNFKVVFDDSNKIDPLSLSTLPNGPMSLYVASDAPDQLLLDYIIVKSVQSYVLSTGNSNSSFETTVIESDKISVSDIITNLVVTPIYPSGTISDSSTIAENITVQRIILIAGESVLTETPKIRESITVVRV